MRVLVGGEFSGRVRDAFAKLGHDAWSCDFWPSEAPGNHLQDSWFRVVGILFVIIIVMLKVKNGNLIASCWLNHL